MTCPQLFAQILHVDRARFWECFTEGRRGCGYIPRNVAAPWLGLCGPLLGPLLGLGTFSSSTSGSQLSCAQERKFPGWPAQPVVGQGLPVPTTFSSPYNPGSVLNSCSCKHVTNPLCPLSPLGRKQKPHHRKEFWEGRLGGLQV